MSKKITVFLRTFGCQMNVRDSEVITGLLKAENWQLTTDPQEAGIIIFNTCSVRQHAEDKVWSEVGRFKLRKKGLFPQGTVPIIGIVGCMAQHYKEMIFERAPGVDFVVGPTDIHKIPGILEKLTAQNSQLKTHSLFERKIWETDSEVRPEAIYRTGFYEDKTHAYVVISEGCSNYCSYCVVPFVRGNLKHRNYTDIVKEIEGAIDKGITKVTLLGQNVNAYQSPSRQAAKSPVGFLGLLELINKIKGLKEFSFITSHPKDIHADLFKLMADSDKLKKYLHLPIQSGSDRILKLMNRGYTRKYYLDLADNYRKIVEDGVLSTDVIVGFPTETEEDFAQTRSLVEEVKFNAAYVFKYSIRPHTDAAKFVDGVPKEEKERRHQIILELQKEISKKIKKAKDD